MTAFPTVRAQLEQWGPTSRRDAPERESIELGRLQLVGRLRRTTFAVAPDGRELRIKGPARPAQIDKAPPDAILVTQTRRDAQGRPQVDTFIGRKVDPGTYERLLRQKTYTPKARRIGAVDGLAELRKPADRQPVPLGPDDDSPAGIIKGALSRRPTLLVTDGTPAPRTVARLVELANSDGANLRRYRGHTLADWTEVRRLGPLLIAAWPLVDSFMAGAPLACAYEHDAEPPPADTLDPAGVAVCNAHVGQ